MTYSAAPRMARRLGAVFCIAFFLGLCAACSAPRYAAGPEFSPAEHDYLRADDSAAFAACVAMCEETTSLALVTRAGCFEGCRQTRDFFPLHDKAFSSRQECLGALARHEAGRETHILEMRRWCDSQWTHVHNRKGCYRAAEGFYDHLAPASVCGTDAAQTAQYGALLAGAREEAARIDETESAAKTSAAGTPEQQNAMPERDGPLPDARGPGEPYPPQREQAYPENAVETTRPAAPLLPPPYAAQQTESARETASSEPARPYLQDTPKYQKKPAAKQPAKPANEMKSAPQASPLPPQTAPGSNEEPGPEKESVPVAQPEKIMEPDAPSAASKPEPPQTDSQIQTPEKIQPEAESPDAQKPDAKQPEMASRLPGARQGDDNALTAPSAVSPPASQSAPAPETRPTRQDPEPAATASPSPEVPALPKPHLPLPQSATEEGEKAAPIRNMPPLPSMLNKTYEAPTIIAPQIEPPR